MSNRKNRLVIDTNLWVSFLLTNNFNKLDSILEKKKVVLVFSQALIDELVEVTQRTKFKKYFNYNDVETLLKLISSRAEFIHVVTKTKKCRDPKDNFLLALCADGKADYLLTGDEDLLVLKKYKTTTIIRITDYLQIKQPLLEPF
ncbi:MAG: putative toxin-antitoxin system toxin component, PIN family [Bacteroidia bacterium]